MSVDWHGPDSGDEREELPAAKLATRQASGHAGMFACGSIGEVANDPRHFAAFHAGRVVYENEEEQPGAGLGRRRVWQVLP